jgi:hypothetical protein
MLRELKKLRGALLDIVGSVDVHYENLEREMRHALEMLGLAA